MAPIVNSMAGWVWVLIGVFAFLGALVALMLRPATASIRVTGDQLIVTLHGLDKIWCVRGKVAVPLDQVSGIEAIDRNRLPRPGVRLPGSYLPGVIIAGSYGLGDNRTFWDIRRATRLLVVNCRPGAAYRQIVLEVHNPDSTAAQLHAQLR